MNLIAFHTSIHFTVNTASTTSIPITRTAISTPVKTTNTPGIILSYQLSLTMSLLKSSL